MIFNNCWFNTQHSNLIQILGLVTFYIFKVVRYRIKNNLWYVSYMFNNSVLTALKKKSYLLFLRLENLCENLHGYITRNKILTLTFL